MADCTEHAFGGGRYARRDAHVGRLHWRWSERQIDGGHALPRLAERAALVTLGRQQASTPRY